MTRRLTFTAAGASALSTSLLFACELVFSGGFPDGVPWAVFGFLAVMSFVAIASLSGAVRRFPLSRFAGIMFTIVPTLAAVSWATLFFDQLPCFLGGKGC